MTNELHGVNPPLITPLDADGQLKDDAFRDEIRYHLDAGVSGVVVGGSTGEGMRMNNDQLQHLYEVAVDESTAPFPWSRESSRGRRARPPRKRGSLATPALTSSW